MGRRIVAACALVVLLWGALAGPAAAQDDIEYLEAVELLYDPDTGALLDPDTVKAFSRFERAVYEALG